MNVDPIDQAVISQGLIASAREMGVKLIRSAYSTILREASDGSAALLDRKGNVVAQAELIPMQLGPLGATFKPCAEIVPPDDLEEGDFYINNSPFEGGQHLPDVFIFSPIFYEGTLVGFSASVAHHLDLGGGAPGMNPDATDVHQEGIIIPPSRYNMQRDWNGGSFERLITANIRVPELTIGDFNAQFAANAIGGERVKQLCARYGVETILSVMESHLAYSERRMRAAISEIPDGVYEGEDAVDDDGIHTEPLLIKATVTVAGDDISVDFTGSASQVLLNLNCPFASTVSAALAAVKAVASSPDIPFNQGLAAPITVTAPYGSLLNPKPPVPVRARMIPAFRAFDAVVKALAKAVPDKVIATGFDTTHSICMSQLVDGNYSIYLEIYGGGYGAGPGSDGTDGVDGPLSNCSNIPVESLDQQYNFFRVTEYALRPDSGGRGKFRGGNGLLRKFEILTDDVTMAHYSDRYRVAPEGAFGGEPGEHARTRVVRMNGNEEAVASKTSIKLNRGDVVISETGGGGGYGDPSERSTDRLHDDLESGLVTPPAAQAAE
ncbi:MAG: methylhydantoinase [Alphaproteobacteria bacterium]|nr:methylhydantoinase [Alphaproteobacteria bacterium]|tara:strand:+ start:1230 stop:2882 length:1653 start_codon:yes stop_codon:yes gene_type:complete